LSFELHAIDFFDQTAVGLTFVDLFDYRDQAGSHPQA